MGSLLDKMRAKQREAKSKGDLETLLDLTRLDHGEFLIFQRKTSLLVHAIQETLKKRSLEETLEALISLQLQGFCGGCYMPIQPFNRCLCPPKL